MRSLRYYTQRHAHVKPVTVDGKPMWGVFRESIWEGLFYDWRDYGPRVALYNFAAMLGLRRVPKSNEVSE